VVIVVADGYSALLLDPFIVGVGVFLIGTVVMVVALTVTTQRRWHDRHHQARGELMCTWCRDRQRQNPASAPRMRVLGERRW
jgi:hypothetical protein